MPTHTRPTIRRSCAGRDIAPPSHPISRSSPAAKVWVQGLPCLVSLCRLRAIFHPGPRPPFGSRLRRYVLFPFSDRFNTPSGAPGPPFRPCLAATTCLPLSTCPSRLNPKLRPVAPGRTSREKTPSTIQVKSNPYASTLLRTQGTRVRAGAVDTALQGVVSSPHVPKWHPCLAIPCVFASEEIT